MAEERRGSQAYRIVVAINDGFELPNHAGLLALLAVLLRPIYHRDGEKRPKTFHI